jgi:hypothetical protein
MSAFRDPRFLWGMGALMLVFGTVGIIGVGAIVSAPLWLAVFAGLSQEAALKIFLYSAVIWAPIGLGMGIVAAGAATRGLRRKPPDGTKRVS